MPVPGEYERVVKSANGSQGAVHLDPSQEPAAPVVRDPLAEDFAGPSAPASPAPSAPPSSPAKPIVAAEPITSTEPFASTETIEFSDPDDLFTDDFPGEHAPTSAGRTFAQLAQPAQSARPARTDHLPDRLRGWINDRLPAPLQGRWRMDHRVGTVLAAVAVIGGIAMGGYALWTAQPDGHPQQYSVTRSAGQAYDQTSDQDSDEGDDHPRDGRAGTPKARSGSGDDPDEDSAMSGLMPMPDGQPAASAATTDPGLMVDVEGKVAHPGVQHLPTGARVLDALTTAGGALPGTDLSNLDQAQVLADGEQILVGPGTGAVAGPGVGAGPPPGLGQSAPAAPKGRTKALPTTPIRLNTATLDQLEELPGVGPALAQRVLDWRTEHGRFTSIDDLQQVKGFGPHKFGAVRDLVAL